MSETFVHLNLHSEYSLVDSTIRIKPLVERVAELGMPAVAITDVHNLFGLIKYYRAAEAAGLKPLVGAEVRMVEPGTDQPAATLQLLVMNHQGYLNLCQLLSRAYLEGQQRGVPTVRRHWVRDHAEGLIALSGARDGDIGQALINRHRNQARALLDLWMRDFPDRFYLELQRTGRDQERDHERLVLELAGKTGCPVVATNEVRFLDADGYDAHEARVCIHEGSLLADKRRRSRYSREQYLKSPEEMAQLFADLPEALANSVEIARRCNLKLELGHYVLPAFPSTDGLDEPEFLRQASARGLEQRLASLGVAEGFERHDYDQRLEEELEVIISMGFPGYFLIVADFILWAKNNGIPVGPGRGSGAGSLVAWVLGITDLDPLRYELLFERFLNPERVSMPDFDVDFCMEKRDQVIDYVAQTYGRDQVSQIITYGSMAAKAVVRDCGRVLGHAYGFVDSIAKLIPLTLGITLKQALEDEPQLRERYQNEEDTRAVLDLAMALEGLTRNAGKHAGGVVIAPSKLTDFSPLFCESGGGGVVTQFDKDDVESVGLVKFDFLGLRTLTIIDWALDSVNQTRQDNGDEPLVLENLPLDDAETFRHLQSCDTTAVFQLESRGMKKLIRRLVPDHFEEIIALVALYRPGPLESGMVDAFIDRKHGRAPVVYPHPELEPILAPTYGVILYQEQVMQIAQVLAGYSLGAADILRRAMGKKKPEEMAKQRSIFVEGATGRGVEEDKANFIFDQMETFAGYGFNKSHSAAYALLSYQTAWLKAHYPADFMAAVLSADMDNTDKVANLIEDCRASGLEIVPPDVNRCHYRFTVRDPKTVRYGLGAIKGVGHNAIESIVQNRADGPYRDLADFCQRVDLQKINRRCLDTLIRSGALDCLDPDQNRARMSERLPEALQAAEQQQRNSESGQNDMFGNALAPPPVEQQPAVLEWPSDLRLRGERDSLGLYLTGHPVDAHREVIARFTDCPLGKMADRLPPAEESSHRRGRNKGVPIVVAGLIMAISRRPGRGAFVAVDDGTGRVEVALFDETYALYADTLVRDEIIVIEGTASHDQYDSGVRLSANRILGLNDALSHYARGVSLSVRGPQNNLAHYLETTFAPYRNGSAPVWVDYSNGRARARLQLGDEYRVKPCLELVAALGELEQVSDARLVY